MIAEPLPGRIERDDMMGVGVRIDASDHDHRLRRPRVVAHAGGVSLRRGDDVAGPGGHNNDESLIEQGPMKSHSRPVRPSGTSATPARADPSVSGQPLQRERQLISKSDPSGSAPPSSLLNGQSPAKSSSKKKSEDWWNPTSWSKKTWQTVGGCCGGSGGHRGWTAAVIGAAACTAATFKGAVQAGTVGAAAGLVGGAAGGAIASGAAKLAGLGASKAAAATGGEGASSARELVHA